MLWKSDNTGQCRLKKVTKTALEITPQERSAYCTAAAVQRRKESRNPQLEKRWHQAQDIVRQAADILRKKFSTGRIILFGSAVRQSLYTSYSDIDLAVFGLPPERFYAAVAAVTGLSTDIRIDLVDAEQCSVALRQVIEREGVEL